MRAMHHAATPSTAPAKSRWGALQWHAASSSVEIIVTLSWHRHTRALHLCTPLILPRPAPSTAALPKSLAEACKGARHRLRALDRERGSEQSRVDRRSDRIVVSSGTAP